MDEVNRLCDYRSCDFGVIIAFHFGINFAKRVNHRRIIIHNQVKNFLTQ